jgi:DNA primase
MTHPSDFILHCPPTTMTVDILDFQTLKRFSIEQLLLERGLLSQCRRHGDRITGPCPVHRGDNPNAFVVTLSRNLWYCFSRCQAGGDVIDLLARLDDVDRITAARRLAGILPPHQPSVRTPADTACQQQRRFRPFTRTLKLDPRASFLQRKGILASTARLFDTGQWRGEGWLAGCIAVRLHDPHGLALGYAARCLHYPSPSAVSKWKLPPALPKSTILYAWHRAASRQHCPLTVVECPWSVMRLHQLRLPAVALLGTGLSETQRDLVATAKRVIIMLDGDPAGQLAARRIARQIANRTDARIARLPPGCDPDDLTDPQLANLLAPFLSLTSPCALGR